MPNIKLPSLRFLLILLLFFEVLTVSHSYAIVDQNSFDKPVFAQNQLIIKYKPGLSKDDLRAQVETRTKEKGSLLGIIKIFLQDLNLKFKRQETPEEKLARIEEVQKQAGVVSEEKLFKSGDLSRANFYLLTTDGTLSVPEAVDIFNNLPEVESAEPDYIQRIQGVEI